MLKRSLDILLSACGLLVASPFLLFFIFLVWLNDRHSPFYIAQRVGRGCVPFNMVKLRSMVNHADRTGVFSTSTSDIRITPIGRIIRRYKIDELTQLWNVLKGDMSLVGPRPQVEYGVNAYTNRERNLLSIRPGITDFASIVFSDEGSILASYPDPDKAYDMLIRPGKSLLGLFYVEHSSIAVDISLVFLTLAGLFSRSFQLKGVQFLLICLHAPRELILLSGRTEALQPSYPPGYGDN